MPGKQCLATAATGTLDASQGNIQVPVVFSLRSGLRGQHGLLDDTFDRTNLEKTKSASVCGEHDTEMCGGETLSSHWWVQSSILNETSPPASFVTETLDAVVTTGSDELAG